MSDTIFSINEVGGPGDAFNWLSTDRPPYPDNGMYGYADDTHRFEFYSQGTWLTPAMLNNASAQSFSGPITLNSTLTMTGGTANGFGKDVGLIPIWDSIDGSNSIFGLNTAKRMVIRRAQASIADNNFADLQISRSTPSLASGSTQANNILYVLGDYGTGDWSNNRGVLVQLGSHQTVGYQIGIWSEIKRYSDGTVPMWALILNTRDQTGLASSAPGMKQNVTAEIGLRSNKADDGSNTSNLGGVGLRRAIHIVAGRDITTDMTENEIAHGLWFGTSDVTDTYDPYTTYLSVIGLGVNGPNGVHTYQVLDTRGAQAPTGYVDPVAAVRMSATHIIDFNGGVTLKSNAGNYLQYTSSGTPRLRYMVGANERFSIANGGGTITYGQATIGTQNSTVSGVIVGNFGSSGGIQVSSPSANANLRLQTKGTGTFNALDGADAFLFTATSAGITSPVNYFVISPSSAGTGPTLGTGGSGVRDINILPGGGGITHIQSNLSIDGAITTNGPSTKTGDYTVANNDATLIFNGAASITLTLPAAASYPGRWLHVRTIAAQPVVSASSNVVPLAGGAAGTAILAGTAGKWADLQSDGANWQIQRSN